MTKASALRPSGTRIPVATLETGVIRKRRGIGQSRPAIHIRGQPEIIGDDNVVGALEVNGKWRSITQLALVQCALLFVLTIGQLNEERSGSPDRRR